MGNIIGSINAIDRCGRRYRTDAFEPLGQLRGLGPALLSSPKRTSVQAVPRLLARREVRSWKELS